MHDVSQIEAGETKIRDDQRYSALRDRDDQSDSSMDIRDWGIQEDPRKQQTRKTILWRKLKRYRWLLDTTLLLVIVGLLMEKRWKHDQDHRYEFAGDVTGFAPRCEDA